MSNITSAATAKHPMTVEQYIAFEEHAEVRHEYINGNLIPMPGTTSDHNYLCMNLVQALRLLQRLHGLSDYRIFQENVKVQITSERDYTYPDIMITNDPRDRKNQYIKKYPVVIFEVLSKTSRSEDSSDKFIRYKNIESLRNYILVDSEKKVVEVRVKSADEVWVAESFVESDACFPVPALGIELPFDDVYEGVTFGKL
ncbi:MAG: Uma2 family endonuclease [Saprospiraceae bacterium]|jgi:Uma2 family endonuclease|nr:Uma2 family endonuclease [Saprospiraceae bacterium]